jgi:cell division protein FtsL
MARSAAAAAPRARTARAAAAPARAKPARHAAAPARSKSTRAAAASARRATRGHAAAPRRAPSTRRVSGATGAPAVALPVRVINAPFARAARRRTSGVLDALLTGRGWIALVFVLLAGIVFLNVDLLQMNREIARNAEKISTLKREIARNRLDAARLASSERIQDSAAQLGLVRPPAGEVRYLKARPGRDARLAAKRITAPSFAYVAPAPLETAPEPVFTPTDPAVTDPAAADPAVTDPATADPAATDPVAAPVTTTPTAPAG